MSRKKHLNRRTFLKGMAGAGLAISTPQIALAAKEKPPEKKRPQEGDFLAFQKGERKGDSIFITNERHRHHLQQANIALDSANKNLDAGYSEELIAVDVNLAIEHLGAVLGKTFAEDLLDKIFSQFCIGK